MALLWVIHAVGGHTQLSKHLYRIGEIRRNAWQRAIGHNPLEAFIHRVINIMKPHVQTYPKSSCSCLYVHISLNVSS